MSMIPITEMRDLIEEYTDVDCTDIEDGNVLIMYQAQCILEDPRASKKMKSYARFNFNSAANATIDTRETLRIARKQGTYKEEHNFGAFGEPDYDQWIIDDAMKNAIDNAPTQEDTD